MRAKQQICRFDEDSYSSMSGTFCELVSCQFVLLILETQHVALVILDIYVLSLLKMLERPSTSAIVGFLIEWDSQHSHVAPVCFVLSQFTRATISPNLVCYIWIRQDQIICT